MTTQQTDTTTLPKILDQATRMCQTDPQGAISLLRALAGGEKFDLQPRAQQTLGIVYFDTGRFEDAEAIFRDLVRDHTDATSFRAENLYYAAAIALRLIDYDLADRMIDEAKQIARAAFDVAAQGRLRQLEGIVSIKRGDYEDALQKITTGQEMEGTYGGFPGRYMEPSAPGSVSRVLASVLG